MELHSHTNALIHESSPYLLQHAHNPVDWVPWGKEALEKASSEDKLLIVSIGYSSCHWCHVMERESFEDPEVARLMNERFVSIKVDREERPDLDHMYMAAVQLLNLQGGWPLNCIALPDGRPIWGGTYFPKANWIEALGQVDQYYRAHRKETLAYAAELAQGIRQQSLVPAPAARSSINQESLHRIVEGWRSYFDPENGGHRGAPKFPMPVNLEFLLHYGVQCGKRTILDHVELTLDSMSRGGICDQVGGGFARYSVDAHWKVPHFEKMGYDNAQLIGLYSSAYQVTRKDSYARVVRSAIEWVGREMISPEGALYSALDADSEGEEGRYYVWTEKELKDILKEEYPLFAQYYNIGKASHWEGGKHILQRSMELEEFAAKQGMDTRSAGSLVDHWNSELLEARSKRVPPGTDDKSLTSWSSLMISGLVKASNALNHKEALDLGIKIAALIRDRCIQGENTLFRSYKSGVASIPGFHIDYALYIEACIDLFSATLDRSWLDLSLKLTAATFEHFYDQNSKLFNFNSHQVEVPVGAHVEIQDNVIPSSNSVMGHNLFRLGHLTGRREFIETVLDMVERIEERFEHHPSGYANWGRLILMRIYPYYEVAVTGKNARALLRQVLKDYHPNLVAAGTTSPSELPLFRNRFDPRKSLIFVCRDHVCQLPYTELSDAENVYHIG